MSERAVHVSKPREGESVVVVGDSYRFLVTGAESGGAYMVMEATVPVGHGPPLHVHMREDEGFYVLEGEVDFESEGRIVRAGPGTLINLPKNVPHRFENRGSVTARMLITCVPAGIEGFFRAAFAEPDRMPELAERYGLTIFPSSEG